MTMKHSIHLPALLLGLVPFAGAAVQDVGAQPANAPRAAAATVDLQAQIDEAIEAFDTQYQAWVKKIRAASEDERDALMAKRPDPAPVAMGLVELVKDEKGSDAQWSALSWAMQAGGGEAMMAASPALIAHFSDKDELGQMVWRMYGGEAEQKFLGELIAKTKSTSVKGMATFGLAGMLKEQMSDDSLSEEEAARIEAKCLELYTSLKDPAFAEITLYRDVKLGAKAAAELFEMENLIPGKMAPEIEAEDVDGTVFKLSDYRGKVVMLDFWGDW